MVEEDISREARKIPHLLNGRHGIYPVKSTQLKTLLSFFESGMLLAMCHLHSNHYIISHSPLVYTNALP